MGQDQKKAVLSTASAEYRQAMDRVPLNEEVLISGNTTDRLYTDEPVVKPGVPRTASNFRESDWAT